MNTSPKKILAVASSGGHLVQLLRLKPAFEGYEVEYMSTTEADEDELGGKLHIVKDANLTDKLKTVKLFFQVLRILIKVRPNYIISTGAAPGFAVMFWGRIMNIHSIWLDSIANSEELSKCGKYAKYVAEVWLTQWPNLSSNTGPKYWGSVL